MIDAPKRIWTTGNDHTGSWNIDDVTHCPGTAYARADIHDAMAAERDAMRAALQQVLHHCRNIGRGSEVVDARIIERCEDTAVAALAALP